MKGNSHADEYHWTLWWVVKVAAFLDGCVIKQSDSLATKEIAFWVSLSLSELSSEETFLSFFGLLVGSKLFCYNFSLNFSVRLNTLCKNSWHCLSTYEQCRWFYASKRETDVRKINLTVKNSLNNCGASSRQLWLRAKNCSWGKVFCFIPWYRCSFLELNIQLQASSKMEFNMMTSANYTMSSVSIYSWKSSTSQGVYCHHSVSLSGEMIWKEHLKLFLSLGKKELLLRKENVVIHQYQFIVGTIQFSKKKEHSLD